MEKKMNDLGDNVGLSIPFEIVFEILSWMTVASLLRCKCVCKQWNEIIQHPKFIQLHMIRSKEDKIYYAGKSCIVYDIHYGLMVVKSTISGKYHVRNTATKQILDIPDPKGEVIYMVIVSIASSNSYKLVYVYEGEREGVNQSIGFKVLNFEGSDFSWRDLENSPSFCIINKRRQEVSISVAEGGLIYLLGFYEDGSKDSEIHCLDVETEILTDSPIIVPRSVILNWKTVKMIIWETKLGLMGLVEEAYNVCFLENPIKKKWAEKKIVIPLTVLLEESPVMKENLVPLSVSSQYSGIWFTDGTHIIKYAIGSKQVFKSQYPPLPNKIRFIGAHTLTTLKGMQPKKDGEDEV